MLLPLFSLETISHLSDTHCLEYSLYLLVPAVNIYLNYFL